MLVSIIALGELNYVRIYKEDHKTGFNSENPLGAVESIYKKMK